MVYKDAKLFPGGSRSWDWAETGTHHSPGIQPADVQELLDHGSTAVVLSTGRLQALGVCPETVEFLASSKIVTHILPTPAAIDLYNQLRETMPVGALIHSTC
ncbi:MAG: MTH938/NDUFAF3 family protein [Anaerolineae bacterium]|nr:MTH938/NDUFAF3 family protein [Anaerolineae bacterium]